MKNSRNWLLEVHLGNVIKTEVVVPDATVSNGSKNKLIGAQTMTRLLLAGSE